MFYILDSAEFPLDQIINEHNKINKYSTLTNLKLHKKSIFKQTKIVRITFVKYVVRFEFSSTQFKKKLRHFKYQYL